MTASSGTCTFQKGFQPIKPAFESSGKRMKMLGCLSFRRKSLVRGPRQLSPSRARCAVCQNPQPTTQRRRETRHPPLSCWPPMPAEELCSRGQCHGLASPVPSPSLCLRCPQDLLAPPFRPQRGGGLQSLLAALRTSTASNLSWSCSKSLLLSSWLWAPAFYLRALLLTSSRNT